MTGEVAVRAAAWLSTILWAASEWRRLRSAPDVGDRAVSALWAAGATALAVHVLLAFHLVHGWSHAAAQADVARQTEALIGLAVGGGVFVNDLFLLLWGADAAWWRLRPSSYRSRPRRLDLGIRLFVGFMFVNGAVVFARGPMRLFGILVFAALAVAWTTSGKRV